ncbi:MAG: DHH family phosphoesterase [Thermoplasmatales archaeon]|nr:DHH family phosphoesterase [Thermoplasmatales archaeon]
MPDRLKGFMDACARGAERVAAADDVFVVAHIDADGISAAAIAALTLDRLGKKRRVGFYPKFDGDAAGDVNSSPESLVWIVDLGSGYLSSIKRDGVLVTDHHVPERNWRKGQTQLDSFNAVVHVNPHEFGFDGSTEISGAGVTYLVSRAVDPANADLAYLAVIGACGDLQDSKDSGLVGINREILNDAVATGGIEVARGPRFFGRDTRPIRQFLQYSSDPAVPGLSGDGVACSRFLEELGVEERNSDGSRRSWKDLSPDEAERISGALLALLSADDAGKVFGENYDVPGRARGMGDAKEFATLLNSCGRYDDAETGLGICLGEPGAVEAAKENRAAHRRNIAGALDYVKKNGLVRTRRVVRYFDSGDAIRDTVVGIVAGMLLNDGNWDMPMIAFADSDGGKKVSARADRSLVSKGLDLSFVMNAAANHVGGDGGGHAVAAGATIPADAVERFLDAVEDIVLAQLI